MLKEGELYFNGNRSLNLNLYLEKYPSIPITNEEYEEIQVEGRSGSLIINKGTYPDKKITFTFTILSPQIDIDFERIYEWLTEIEDNRLIFGREDRCYKVKKVNFKDIKKQFRTIGEFDVTFLCEPFTQDLEKTVHEITSSGYKIYYNGNAPGDTLIKVYGTENIQLTVNSETMQINNVADYVEIDSDLLQVRNKDKTSKDDDTSGDFILLEKGINAISYTGNVTKIIVEYTTKYKC
ncbi:distal tail protein Dit [Clostridium tertium]|jgi:predicted phage tail component-like protein|uniref:distal tail protein Dit n=1 Tax=Clostridium tertium TaxID=1559 RepID=UPI000DCFB6E8|nr:distal tail protein Dit [Clostridium tertium]MDB1939227.1 phage tail family protein [Clostridium tertium]DAO81824.1 MAG TPA: distal tail protein [Caudoviricetes sp.]DAY56927.1 MAG TPA: distal tail protein [Caudoviricetes sp.]